MTHQLYNLFFARNICDSFCFFYDIVRFFCDIYYDMGHFFCDIGAIFYDIGISHNNLERGIVTQ